MLADGRSPQRWDIMDLYRDHGPFISVSAVVADTGGLHRATLDAVHRLHTDSELEGLHIMGGSPISAGSCRRRPLNGSDLKLALECAFHPVMDDPRQHIGIRHDDASVRDR